MWCACPVAGARRVRPARRWDHTAAPCPTPTAAASLAAAACAPAPGRRHRPAARWRTRGAPSPGPPAAARWRWWPRTVLVGQAILGWVNDVADRRRDAAATVRTSRSRGGWLDPGTVWFASPARSCSSCRSRSPTAPRRGRPTSPARSSSAVGNRFLHARVLSLAALGGQLRAATRPSCRTAAGAASARRPRPTVVDDRAGGAARPRRARPARPARPRRRTTRRATVPADAARAADRHAPAAAGARGVVTGARRGRDPASQDSPSGSREPGSAADADAQRCERHADSRPRLLRRSRDRRAPRARRAAVLVRLRLRHRPRLHPSRRRQRPRGRGRRPLRRVVSAARAGTFIASLSNNDPEDEQTFTARGRRGRDRHGRRVRADHDHPGGLLNLAEPAARHRADRRVRARRLRAADGRLRQRRARHRSTSRSSPSDYRLLGRHGRLRDRTPWSCSATARASGTPRTSSPAGSTSP